MVGLRGGEGEGGERDCQIRVVFCAIKVKDFFFTSGEKEMGEISCERVNLLISFLMVEILYTKVSMKKKTH